MSDVEVNYLLPIIVLDEVLMQRILNRTDATRSDDNPESLRKLLVTYHEQTLRAALRRRWEREGCRWRCLKRKKSVKECWGS
jgi:adenylate kinase family enzyme